MTDGLTLNLKNSLEEIPKLADAIEEFAMANDVPMPTYLHVTLALDELVTNIISYGYGDDATGDRDITVSMVIDGPQLVTVLEDDGKPFDPISVPPPDIGAELEDRAIGGLGVHFVKTFMDSVDYKRVESHNRLTMRKTLNAKTADDR